MVMYCIRRWRFWRRKAQALREIRRNDWRSPWLGNARSGLRRFI